MPRACRQRGFYRGFVGSLIAGLVIAGAMAAARGASAPEAKKTDNFQTSIPAALLLDPDSNRIKVI